MNALAMAEALAGLIRFCDMLFIDIVAGPVHALTYMMQAYATNIEYMCTSALGHIVDHTVHMRCVCIYIYIYILT